MSSDRPAKWPRLAPPEPGLYVLRPVGLGVPLHGDDDAAPVSITCLEFWNDHLYVGTSAGEILHLVAIPSESEGDEDDPTFILASRLQPSGYAASGTSSTARGIQQILVLPGPLKACVLCNGVVSFYTLPEFSPAFPNREPTGVQWIGGVDENEDPENPDGPVVMIATAKKILQVRVGERLRQVKNNIEYPGCLRASRRDTIACVADDDEYALLDVEHQQKIPLFPISSQTNDDEPAVDSMDRSPLALVPPVDTTGHTRSTSMGNLPSSPRGGVDGPGASESGSLAQAGSGLGISPAPTPTPRDDVEVQRPRARPRASTDSLPSKTAVSIARDRRPTRLRPHVLSPFATEFLLTTGTTDAEPGVGMFVNLDGDVVRGTIEFETYPEDVLVDNFRSPAPDGEPVSDDYAPVILALLRRKQGTSTQRWLEVQQVDNAEGAVHPRSLVKIPLSAEDTLLAGLHRTFSAHHRSFAIARELLQLVPWSVGRERPESDPRTQSAVQQVEQEQALFESQSGQGLPPPSVELVDRRAAEEAKLARRFGQAATRNLVWQGRDLFLVFQNPLISQLEHRLMQLVQDGRPDMINSSQIFGFLASIHSRDPKDEAEFLTLGYIRQKASLLLFLHVLTQLGNPSFPEDLLRAVENTLHDGGLDPRIVLCLLPPLTDEVLHGREGIWLYQGIAHLVEGFHRPTADFGGVRVEFWMMMRHFLMLWQEKRGFGSIADDKNVFDSVDAALLHVLLYLDQALPADSPAQRSVRTKLHNVVDHWKGDFQRAIVLLEQYNRLYVLSRLYQSKKQTRDILATWKRIIQGEGDVDYGSNTDYVQGQVRRYLTRIRDADLIQEYALWLAHYDPNLTVEVFTDDAARVKFNPEDVVPLLKTHAPGAVQPYLEHLVFGKNLDRYANDLIGYYLDSVLTVLETSDSARTSLAESYSTYRALESPKPTYLDFISQNAPPGSWWQYRLRLLQLLGSGVYATGSSAGKDLTYSVTMVLERLAPFSTFLVSESIILDARQGRHKEALNLLTHGLGDFDTAIRYCYFGSPSPSPSHPIDASDLPAPSVQRELFGFLFHEFLQIQDAEDCVERTSQLLGKFATFFDPLVVLQDIPPAWTVGTLAEFLVRSFRAATTKKNQAVILKALSAAQNLQSQAEFVEACEKLGARLEEAQNGVGEITLADVNGD